MNALTQLDIYNSDDESDSSEEDLEKPNVEKLPLPDFLHGNKVDKHVQREENEDGKIRNFPHEPGIWATFVYVPVKPFPELIDYLEQLQEFFQPIKLNIVDDFHISLTKTVILRHHWIQGFVDNIHHTLDNTKAFTLFLNGLKVYVNEHKTRTFVSLKVDDDIGRLESIVTKLDMCLSEYNLEPFYSDPSFHLSLVWCPGDKLREINSAINKLPSELKNFNFSMKFLHCECISGNKLFKFSFR